MQGNVETLPSNAEDMKLLSMVTVRYNLAVTVEIGII
jgi:hypothetical protein